jgi:hypothetical protein
VTTVPSAEPARPVPPLFDRLVDDTRLLAPRAAAVSVETVVTEHLAAREGPHGGLVGQLVCPLSQLPPLVRELARRAPARPVDVSLVVNTGLGAVPKALSTVFSRSGLITPRTIETVAPVDVDAVWLERVAEFVPEDVVAVVEPLRPVGADEAERAAWLDAVRRVSVHGCTPKLRCGGARPSDVPSVAEVARFVEAIVEVRGAFVTLGLHPAGGSAGGAHRYGVLNLLVATARAQWRGDVEGALAETDGAVLAAEARALDPAHVTGVRALLARCGTDADRAAAAELAALGLLESGRAG